MSKYTTEVRFICESKAGLTESAGFNSIDQIVENAAPYIFNFSFPIYDEAYRLPLEKRILKHYYTREICEETVGLWQLRLEDRLNLIMPYYNKLYESALINFNPLYDVDLTTEHDRKNDESRTANEDRNNKTNRSVNDSESNNTLTNANAESERIASGSKSSNEKTNRNYNENNNENSTKASNNTSTNDSSRSKTENEQNVQNNNSDDWSLFSDTPQGGITGIFNGSSQLSTGGYLTNATNDIKNGSEIGNREATNNETENQTTSTNENETNRKNNEKTTNEIYDKNNSENNADTEKINNTSKDAVSSNRNKDTTESESMHSNSSQNSLVDSIETYFEHVYGKRGNSSYSKLITEFRATFLKIDNMLLNELSDLFFGLW